MSSVYSVTYVAGQDLVVAFPGGASASAAPATSDQPAPIVKPKWASD
jgi:hypothetical protein